MSAPSQSAQPNPEFFLFDTDALIQIFLPEQVDTLKTLKRRFGIQPSVVEAVEVEMMRGAKPKKAKCRPAFRKALDGGLIQLLDAQSIGSFTTNDARATYESIQLRGLQNSASLDYGEAYTHAAATVLNLPVVSNDISAVATALKNNIALGRPLLRVYDLFVLRHQIGELSANDCDAIRQALVAEGDGPHPSFRNSSFASGLSNFYARVVDVAVAIVGAANPIEPADQRISISKR